MEEGGDVEAYLTTFEHVMTAYEVPRDRWSFTLAPQLIGKAQQAYAAMDYSHIDDYVEVKAAILGDMPSLKKHTGKDLEQSLKMAMRLMLS